MKKVILLFVSVFLIISLSAPFGLAEAENVTAMNNSVQSISIINFFPLELQVGDVQLNIQIRNNNNETLSNVLASLSGSGYSTYNVIPIDSLGYGEKNYIFVSGRFERAGNINLTIRINGNLFYENISVIDSVENKVKEDELKKQQEQVLLIQNLTSQINDLRIKFDDLDLLLEQKKEEDYDVSKISLNDLKTYIRNTQANILSSDLNSAKVNINLAFQEYEDLSESLNGVKKISLIQRIKNNAVLFSTIAGALITFFALYELLKRQGSAVASKVSTKKKKKK